MKKNFKTFSILIIFLVFIAGYCFFNPQENFVYNMVGYITYPFQKITSLFYNRINDYSYQFEEKERLQNEIDDLKKEISNLQDSLIDYKEAKRENAKFAKYYEFKKQNNSLKFTPADVIGIEVGNPFCNFTIDKGKKDGILVHDIVITENGVVGYISEVADICSKVRSILSPDCKISVSGIESQESGTIIGRAEQAKEGLTRMMFVSSQNSLTSGEIIATTGVSGMYPKNLKIGEIKLVEYDSEESTHYALIKPFQDMKNIKDVFVVTDFRGKNSSLSEN